MGVTPGQTQTLAIDVFRGVQVTCSVEEATSDRIQSKMDETRSLVLPTTLSIAFVD